MKIAICDDSKSDALAAKEVIKQTLNELHLDLEFEYYSEASDIEQKLLIKKEPLDILILDIDMPEISGLELAERIRSNNTKLIIIFLSNHEEFVYKAIEFQPFRYIRKIKLKAEMPLAIKAATRIIEIQRDKQIALNTDDGEISVMISEIMYFETEMRKVAIHLQNGSKLLVNKTISQIQELISKDNFIMIHRSCVVNANYISNMKDSIIYLKNGERLLSSRRKFKDIKRQVLILWGESI